MNEHDNSSAQAKELERLYQTLAQEAPRHCDPSHSGRIACVHCIAEVIQKARAEEREACAQIAEKAGHVLDEVSVDGGLAIAMVIRGRSEP